MKFFALLAAAVLVASSVVAHPAPVAEDKDKRYATPTVQLTFISSTAEFNLSIIADGREVQTNSELDIKTIEAIGFDAFGQCTFNTEGEKTLAPRNLHGGVQKIDVGPPQPICSVSCKSTCDPTYNPCYYHDY